jgi:uncharacterized protein with NRDE domain
MCTLAIYFRVFSNYPVAIAANRDEFLDRPASPPVVLAHNPEVVGGKDLKAGGTWLGLNSHGLIAGLLNRHSDLASAGLRSRGLLCLDALGFATAADAARHVARQNGANYNYFNLLLASREEAFVAYNRRGEIEVATLTPGLHLLTNVDVDDFECSKISLAYDRFAALPHHLGPAPDPDHLRRELARLLADHATQLDPRSGRLNSLCLHLEGYGTRSSSLIFLGAKLHQVEHFFAEGPPCRTDFKRALTPAQEASVDKVGADRGKPEA